MVISWFRHFSINKLNTYGNDEDEDGEDDGDFDDDDDDDDEEKSKDVLRIEFHRNELIR